MNNIKVGDIVYPKQGAVGEQITVYRDPTKSELIADTLLVEIVSDIMFSAYSIKNILESINALDSVTVALVKGMANNCRGTLDNILDTIGNDLTQNIQD